MTRKAAALALIACLARAGISGAVPSDAPDALPADASAQTLVESCRSMVPQDVDITGRIILRNRRGIVQSEYAYELKRKNGETSLSVRGDDGAEIPFERKGRLLGTDVTWSDLTLDYLWWDDFRYDDEREGETVHGQLCSVILMKKREDAAEGGVERVVRVWVDRKTGAMMQAEELANGRAIRRLWGTRIKKFGERWAPNVLEVETVGSGHRTKITVETLT